MPQSSLEDRMAESLQLSQITAVMLGVRDIPAALAFYRDKLGLKVIMLESQIALLQCGTVMLGLNRGLAQAAPQVVGATEVVFRVESVRAARTALIAQGVAFLDEPRQVTPTDWVAHFRDVDGHLLSIFGPQGQE
ncbi:MAG TPA: VOC family protein [Candidatus Acidoferrum sp.]|nr:VOC family protein [Candidatus Acidoferrum sp.]